VEMGEGGGRGGEKREKGEEGGGGGGGGEEDEEGRGRGGGGDREGREGRRREKRCQGPHSKMRKEIIEMLVTSISAVLQILILKGEEERWKMGGTYSFTRETWRAR